MSFSYLFDPNKQFQDRNGVNNVGGFLRVYIDGTDDRATTYKDFNGTLNEADIMLDTDGRAVVIVDDSLTFRIEVYERGGALQWTVTQFTARGEGGGGGSSTPVVVDGTANEIDVTESMTAGVKYYTIGLATVVKNTLLGLLASLSNLVGILNSKADKVQGATAGNLAALDASGNLTDSGSKAADFKTKQTPVSDPSADGAGLSFIDSVTQDANGEITPHKKAVQDGTTAQKGVVQLQDSIGSTESSTDKAVTPHAVREAINAAVSSAYHAAGTKSVAQLTSSLLVAENEGCVYNITDSGTTTSDFVDGAGHPINAGDNVGVCDVGGGVYKFDLLSGFVDLSNYLTNTGDASNTTSSLTKASGDTSTMTSGGKLSAIFTAISSFFASLKALAFKDKVSDSDINGTISDSHIASASTWNGKQNSLGISSSGDTGKFLNERGAFTTPNYPSVPSVIDNLTSTSTTDALSAAQGKALNDGKVNKPIQIGASSSKPWVRICSGTVNQWNSAALVCNIYQRGYANVTALSAYVGKLIFSIFRQNDSASYPTVRNLFIDSALRINNSGVSASLVHDGSGYYELWIRCTTNEGKCSILEEYSYNTAIAFSTPYTDAEFSSYISDHSYTRQIVQNYGIYLDSDSVTSVGSPTIPVYVDSNGQVKACTQGATLKSNTATLYIAGYTDSNIPYYHVKDIKNGCVNHVAFSGITNSTCDITFEAPTLSTGEEYDYVISLEGYNNNTGVSTGAYVENCKQILHYIGDNNIWTGEPLFLQATDWRQICVVRGNTCEWKRVALS